jgi:uncharacterized protein
MPAFRFAGHEFRICGGTALFWPARCALIVADLHLEKASWFAQRGQMLPPQDSLATLEKIATLITSTGAHEIWCLGDNFHDDDGAYRMQSQARDVLAGMTTRLDWHWITGNHDEHLPKSVGGTICAEAEVAGIFLRHQADPQDLRSEMSGHFHPKYRASGKRGGVTRACFVRSASKLILPSFGALTGGLHAAHPEIMRAIGAQAEALIPTADRVVRFPLTVE